MRSLSLTPWCVFAGVLCLGFPHHLAALGLRVAFIGLLAWLLSKSTRRCRHIFVLCVALSLPLVSIGLFSSERLIVGLDRWATVAGFSVAFLAASSAPDETRAQVLTGLFWAAAAQSIWAMLEAILTGSRASAGFFNPNHLGAWLLIVGTSAGLDKRPWFSLLCAGGVVATGSRSALIALLLITLVFLLQQKKGRLMVGAIGVAGAAVATLPSIRNRFIGVGDAYAFDRLQIWATALRAGWLEPWGWGLGDARIPLRILGVPLQHGEVRYPKVATQAHSEWLEWWIEFGLLGVVLLAVVLVAVAALPKSIGKLPLLVAVSVPASFGASLRAPLIAFTAAIVLANVATAETDPLPRKHKVALVLLAALAVVATAPASLARLAREHAARLRDAGEMSNAVRWSSLSLRLGPHVLANHLMDASLEFQVSRDPEAAIQRLGGIAARFPSAPEPADRAHRVLSQLDSTPERLALRARLAARRTELEPKNALRWVSYSDQLAATGKTLLSQQALEQALKLEPNCARALIRLADLEADPGERARLAERALHANDRAKRYQDYPAAILSLSPQAIEHARSLVSEDFSIPKNPLDLAPL